MKTYLAFLLGLMLCCPALQPAGYAQGIYRFWGTTYGGGLSDRGTLFSTSPDGSGHRIHKEFKSTYPGKATLFNAPVWYEGAFYSILPKNEYTEAGIITRYDPVTQAYEQVADLSILGARYLEGKLTAYNNKLYGTATGGGLHDDGVLFEFNPATGQVIKLRDFESATGSGPCGELLVYNNRLYGTTRWGGDHDRGVVFELNPGSGTYSVKAHFGPAAGGAGGGLILYEGKFWGAGYYGVVFSYNPATQVLAEHASLQPLGLEHVYGKLAVLNNRFYAATNAGGLHDLGGIFEFNPATNAVVKKFDFNPHTSQRRCELTVAGGKLFSAGGFTDPAYEGMIFAFDPVSNVYENRIYLNPATGTGGCGSLSYVDGKLYGFTYNGGAYGEGTLFEFDPVINSFSKLQDMGGEDLYHPELNNLIDYQGKLYGLAERRLPNDDIRTCIYSFDPASGTFTVLRELSPAEGRAGYSQGGFIRYNHKFYTALYAGGAQDRGTLVEYDPATNDFLKLHDFTGVAGGYPEGRLVVSGGKLYGTCNKGSTHDAGNIFEFNLATQTYAQKVVFGPGMGAYPEAGLTPYNGKLYGVTTAGGNHNLGVLFEYNPGPNGYQIKAHFNGVTTGSSPSSNLVVHQNMLYGLSELGGAHGQGVLYAYDPATGSLSDKIHLSADLGRYGLTDMVAFRDKLYGTTAIGGQYQAGTVFEYDPVTNMFVKKHDFSRAEAQWCTTRLLPLEAPVAPGKAGECIRTSSAIVDNSNAYEWIAFTDSMGNAVAEINANGNLLGRMDVRFFTHDGPMREDGHGALYLDRNISISSQFEPLTPVSVRLYIRNAELEDLMAASGGAVASVYDLAVFKNDDSCQSGIVSPAEKVTPALPEIWSNGYVFYLDVSSFSTFFFAGDQHTVLPVRLLSFEGEKQAGFNYLSWEAAVQGPVRFTLERSGDGKSFTPIDHQASGETGPGHFDYADADYLPGQNFYRLRWAEAGGVFYSDVISLDRAADPGLKLLLTPNPVEASQAVLHVLSTQDLEVELTVTDITGRQKLLRRLGVSAGRTRVALDLDGLAAGVYFLRFSGKGHSGTIRFVKK